VRRRVFSFVRTIPGRDRLYHGLPPRLPRRLKRRGADSDRTIAKREGDAEELSVGRRVPAERIHQPRPGRFFDE
jgi:hypothetical protein